MFEIKENVQEAISNRVSEEEIFRIAKHNGLITLAESGMRKVARNMTTLEEVARVAEVMEVDKELQQEEKPGLNVRILTADDDEYILNMLETRLKYAGYEILKARDGKELIKMAVSEKPDLIITDVTMPKMNGFEATRELKKRLETTSIPILMLTARSDTESELQGIEIGADDYVTKPFDVDKLLVRIKMLLRRA